MNEFLTAILLLGIAVFWLAVNIKAGETWLKLVSIVGMLGSIGVVMYLALASVDQLIQ